MDKHTKKELLKRIAVDMENGYTNGQVYDDDTIIEWEITITKNTHKG